MERCKKCDEYFCNDRCKEYLIYHEDYYGEEKQSIYAHSYEGAVEKYATGINDENDIGDLFDDPIEVTHNGITKRFNCCTEPELIYHVSEAKE